jgi:hypothetical protein
MRSPETDPMWSPQTGARTRAPRSPPVELDTEGQALRERLRAFRTQAVRKNTKFQRALPRLSRSPLEY